MNVTEMFVDLETKVCQLDDIDFIGPGTKELTDNYVGLHRACSGYDGYVIDPNIDHSQLKFVLRVTQYKFQTEPKSYREGFVTTHRFMVLSDRIEGLYDLTLKYLEDNPQYFRTFTDEWGRVHGEKD